VLFFVLIAYPVYQGSYFFLSHYAQNNRVQNNDQLELVSDWDRNRLFWQTREIKVFCQEALVGLWFLQYTFHITVFFRQQTHLLSMKSKIQN